MGIEDAKALVYFVDLENQGGAGASARVAKAAATQAGTMAKVNLSALHDAAMEDRVMGRYATRRKETYSKAASLTFSSGDSNTNKTQTGGKETMATMISNSGHDENGKYSGGQAGDNNGTEWAIIPWYNRPWNCVLRHPDPAIRKLIAELAVEAANNNHIGYDQYQRETFWTQLQKVGYHPSKITVNCEADCSAGVCAIVKAVGYLTGNSKLQRHSATYTGNMKQGLKAAGFEVLAESKYLTSGDYLIAGDILLNERAHTATAVTNGVKAGAGNNSQTSNNSAYKVGDIVEFTGTKHYASSNDTSAKACKPGKAKATAVYNGKHPYHLVAEKNGDSTVYGWVDATDIKTKGAYKVGDIVEFTGTKHYASSNDTSAKACKPGKAKVTAVYNGKHPYHLVAEKNGGSTVYGWVDTTDIK